MRQAPPMRQAWPGLFLLALLAWAAAGCGSITGPPAGGTPYGLEERSHGKT